MSLVASRRNGKAASCEPCRKAKIRCSHERPVCARCQKRGLPARCVYHPAPLTKSRGPASGSTDTSATHVFSLDPDRAFPRQAVDGDSDGGTQASAGALPKSRYAPPTQDTNVQTRDDIAVVTEVLGQLRHLGLIQRLLFEYTAHAHAALVPTGIVHSILAALFTTVSAFGLDYTDNATLSMEQAAEKILSSSAVPAEVTSNLDVERFLDRYTGSNLRLETIGLIYSIAARACLLGLARDDAKHDDFVQDMFRCSATCLRLARKTAPDLNDVITWLAFENLRLSTVIEGESSPNVWRRLGEVASDLLAFGIHRESFNSYNTPFFLAECRRRTFMAAYQMDKYIATLFDRPPRILRRYADCRMPLDLSDTELLAEPLELEQARLRLTEEGWNAEGKYVPSTWARVRYMLGVFREEILEYSFRPPTLENNAELKNLSTRCSTSWESLPAHLRYTTDCWDRLPPPVCLMLTVMFLLYKQSDFQIHRLLEPSETGSSHYLLTVSAEIVSTVLYVGTCLNKAVFLRHDFAYIVLGYGLPSAAVLATALHNISRSGGSQVFPSGISRSTLIRNLSVFVSHLESICTPGEANYKVSVQASKALSRTLDEVLDPPAPWNTTSRSTNGPHTPASPDANLAMGATTTYSPSQTMPFGNEPADIDFDIMGGDGFEVFDLVGWAKSIDWAGTGGEWSTF